MRSAASYLAVAVLAGVLALHTDAAARTWYVAEDGTGDAPDISSAFDSTAVGDTILVGPGTFTLSPHSAVPVGTTLISQYGPGQTRLLNGNGFSYAILVDNDATLAGFWIYAVYPNGYDGAIAANYNVTVANNVVESDYGLEGLQIYSGEVHHNLFIGNTAPSINAVNGLDVTLHHNIILNGVDCSSGTFVSHCNDVLGDILCGLDSSSFSLDPQFCGVDNYFLQSDSPCAPGNHPSALPCGQIGPFPVGCGTVDTEEHSWGSVKSIYRE